MSMVCLNITFDLFGGCTLNQSELYATRRPFVMIMFALQHVHRGHRAPDGMRHDRRSGAPLNGHVT